MSIALLAASAIVSVSCGGDDSPTEPTPVCSYTIAPSATLFTADAGSGNVTVTTAADCSWNATASAGWMTITSGATGNGPGTVVYTVTANSSTQSRTGTLSIGGQTHTVAQQGHETTVCSYEISPGSADFGKDEARGTLGVNAQEECVWTATSNASWLIVTSGGQGTGNGTVSYTVTRNTDVAGRNAAITVGDKTFSVRQAGDIGNCQYSVAPVQLSSCMPAGSMSATVTTHAGCAWTVAPNVPWMTIPSGSSGSGSATITIAYSENYDAPREGIAMVRWPTPTAGQNIRLSQAGCTYAVSSSSFDITASGGSGTFNVLQQSQPTECGGATQDRCVWSAVSDVPWVAVSGSMPRMGDNSVAFTVAANGSTTSRVGRITVRDKVVVISQGGR
jgi:hypothetical protein